MDNSVKSYLGIVQMQKAALLMLAFCTISAFSVTAQITFRKAIGNPGEDIANCVRQTSDGGYVICGVTSSADGLSSNVYLLKIDEVGDLVWSRNFGSALSVDVGNKVLVLETGELLVVGFTNSGGSNGYDVLLIKADAVGNEIWRNTYGGASWDFGHDVIVMPNGNYGVAGSTYSFGQGGSDGYFLEVSSDGAVVRETTNGTAADEEFRSLVSQNDRLFFCGSVDNTTTGKDALMVCTDLSGNEIWRQVWGGSEEDFLSSVISTSDGKILSVGTSSSNETVNKQLYFIKVSTDGVLFFERSDGGAAEEEGREIVEGADGNYTAIGYTTSYGAGGSAMFLFTVSTDGWWVLSRQYGSPFDEEGNSICVTQDGGFVLSGYTKGFGSINSNVFVLKTDGAGLTGETGEVVNITDTLLSLPLLPSGDGRISIAQADACLKVFTDRSTGYLKAEIYDMGGSFINSVTSHDVQMTMDIRSLTNGIYIVRVTDSRGSFATRIGIVR